MRLLQPELLCPPKIQMLNEVLTPPPSAMVFGSEGFGRQLDLDEL